MTPKSGHLPPQKVFSTLQLHGSGQQSGMVMTPLTPSTPGTSSKLSDVESLDSVDTSSTTVTPDFSRMKLERGRGRPRKKLVTPTIDDFPNEGTDEEKTKYIRKKNHRTVALQKTYQFKFRRIQS